MPLATVTRRAAVEGAAKRGSPSVAAATPSAFYQKTQMCKFYASGRCKRGANCFFAHSSAELKETPDLSRTRMCPNLQGGGRCTNRECKYAHRRTELRAPVLRPAPRAAEEGTAVARNKRVIVKAPAESSRRQLSLAEATAGQMQSSAITPEVKATVAAPASVFISLAQVVSTPYAAAPAVQAIAAQPPALSPQNGVDAMKMFFDLNSSQPSFSRRTTHESKMDEVLSDDSFSWYGIMDDNTDEQDLQGYDLEEWQPVGPLPRHLSDEDLASEGRWQVAQAFDVVQMSAGEVGAFSSSPSQTDYFDGVASNDVDDGPEARYDVDIVAKNTFLELVARVGAEPAGLRRSSSAVF